MRTKLWLKSHGNQYRVLPKLIASLANEQPSKKLAKPTTSHINHDHEDLKIHDHQSEVITIYKTTTGKQWSKADQRAYEQISHLPVEQLVAEMRAISERSAAPIGSFAYFATSIKKALAEGKGIGHAGQSTARRRIEEWATQLRQAHVGDATYSIFDLSADLKDHCAREEIPYTAEEINEIVNRH